MSRISRVLLMLVLLVFVLACNFVSRPFQDVQNAASTVEAIATAKPLETLESLTTALPVQTLEALPSALPDLTTALPDIENIFNPTGTPVAEWNNIPVMEGATAGQEFSSTSYSFAVPSAPNEVQDFYNKRMKDLGWSSLFGSQVSDDGGLLLFQKDSAFLTMTIVKNPNGDQGTVVNFQLVSQ